MNLDIERVIKRLQNMTEEEWDREVLKLNGFDMSETLLDKVLDEVKRVESLDSDALYYRKDEYKITGDEFRDVYHYISAFFPEKECNDAYCDEVIYFTWKGDIFRWSIMMGQGSFCQLSCISTSISDLVQELIVDPTLRFYKNI